ncbi:uncharacterized protein LOC112560209 isoform X2 [Pomacea canaliculata]|uniref:uncharacterized protein LOC112560209 isoform X2 n=1 Tax=Pomacea canaliculata TaxID=400727 RepID=UPI000D73EEF4|nr:uncharacterized protein LOC112560209 isoform X2 [Pomacea canaliculata]
MTYFPVRVTWSVASDVCQALSTPGSQVNLVMPTNDAIADTVITLLQNSTIPKVWLGDLLSANQDNALWLNGSANVSPSCVSVTYHVTSGLQRESESCLLPQAAVLCQKLEKNNCTFRNLSGMAISSDWVLGQVRSVNECLDHCNSFYYKGLECWAVTVNNRTRTCYLYYARTPVADDHSQILKVGANYFVLYIRTCFRTSVYDFSSTLINSLLYPDNSSVMFLLPSTDSMEVISEVELSATPLQIMVSVVEEYVVTVQVDVETKVAILATSVFDLGITEALPFEAIKDTTRLQTTTNNPTIVAKTTWNSLPAVSETTSVTPAATTTLTAKNILTLYLRNANTTTQAANASITNGTTLTSSSSVTKAMNSATVTSASGVTQAATYDYTNASPGQTSTNTSASSDVKASAAVSTAITEASAKVTYVATKTTTQTLDIATTTQVDLLPSTGMFAESAASTSAFAATKPFQTVGFNLLIPSYQNVQQGQTKTVTSLYVQETTGSKQTDQLTSILQLLGPTTSLPPSSRETTAGGGMQQGAGQTTLPFSSLAYFDQTSSSEVDHSTAGYGNEAVTRELSATPAMRDAATLCACYALCVPTETSPEFNNSSLQDLLEDMLVDYKSTSRSRRKLVSVQDDRPSARMLGSMGTAILLSVASLVLALDLCSLGRWLANRK